MKKLIVVIISLLSIHNLFAQFHTLNMPQSSPRVIESQKLGVTKITIDYGSPSLNGREPWIDSNIIPQNGDPIPWRAGANMATTINFTTDVYIENNLLKAGKYGLHIVPNNDKYTILFAHNYNQWGSYYLDIEKDVSLSVTVLSKECQKSEQLDFEFFRKTENSLIIGLEWDNKQIPFKVKVDLNKTVVESFRHELQGINTYHWQAWNDAALWCLNHDTNLEEALQWIDRSINGGYNNFGANRNFVNVSTKIRILKKMNKTDEFQSAYLELKKIDCSVGEAYDFSRYLVESNQFELAVDFLAAIIKKYPESWFILLNNGIANYFSGDKKKGITNIEKAIQKAPESYHDYLNGVIEQMNKGTYGS